MANVLNRRSYSCGTTKNSGEADYDLAAKSREIGEWSMEIKFLDPLFWAVRALCSPKKAKKQPEFA